MLRQSPQDEGNGVDVKVGEESGPLEGAEVMSSSPSPVPVEDLLDDASSAWARLVLETLNQRPSMGQETLSQGLPSQPHAGAASRSSASASAGSCTAQSAVSGSALETGMLDMSAFGLVSHEPEQKRAPARSGLESGQLDLGAFGFGGTDSPEEAVPPSVPASQGQGSNASAAIASGMLDLSAFGFGGFHHEPEETSAAAVQSGGRTSAVDSGMLDPTAFGFGGQYDEPVQAWQTSSALESGTVDPGAFGFGRLTDEPVQATHTPRASLATSVATGMIDLSSFGIATSLPEEETHVAPRTAAVQPGLESGLPDMSAFGLGYAMESHVEPHQEKPNGVGGTHSVPPARRPPRSPFGVPAIQNAVASTGNPGGAGAGRSVPVSQDVSGKGGTAMKGGCTGLAVPSSSGSGAGSQTLAGGKKAARVVERRWKVSPPPFSPLSSREVADLERLTGAHNNYCQTGTADALYNLID